MKRHYVKILLLFALILGTTSTNEQEPVPSARVETTDKIPFDDDTPLKTDLVQDRDGLYQAGITTLFADHADRDLAQALAHLEQAAGLGHSGAQFLLGLCHSNGLLVPRSEARAVLYLTFAAMGDDTHAQLALASRYFHGYSVSKSCPDAMRNYRKVADKVARHYRESGVLAHIEKISLHDEGALQLRQTEEDIMQFYQYSADKGETHSSMVLGRAHMYGARGVTQDALQAKHYFERAVEAGEAAGHGGLGQLYAQGVEGGPNPLQRNYSQAAVHFQKGADLGHPVSLNGMGFLHMKGNGVPLNHSLAAKFFQRAADLGNAEAQYNLGVLYLNGEGVTRDTMKALKLLQQSSQQGQILAHYQLGNVYADGTGLPQPNCPMAVRYFKSVCEKGSWNTRFIDAYNAYTHGENTNALLHYLIMAEEGYEVGQSNVAYMYDHQLGLEDIPLQFIFPITEVDLKKDDASEQEEAKTPHIEKSMKDIYKERAFMWYKRSADQGNVDSIISVGDSYYYGWGTPVDMGKSVERYREAADKAHPRALFNLGYMHQAGLGLPRDFHLAKRYYDQAAAQFDKAWTPVQMALAWLLVLRAHHYFAPTGELLVFGVSLENLLLGYLLGLLAFLLWFRSSATRRPRDE